MIITRESVIDFSESIEQFGNIFKEAGINESEVSIITEASVKEIFGKIKEFLKKIYDKFMEMFKTKANTIMSGEKTFESIYNKNRNKLDLIFKKIESQEIPDERLEGHEFYLFERFNLDDEAFSNVYNHSSVGSLGKDDLIEFVIGKNKYDVNKFLYSIKFQKENNLKYTIESMCKCSFGNDHHGFKELEGYESLSEAKNKIEEICTGEKKPITGRNISNFRYKFHDLAKNKDVASMVNKFKASAKLAYDNAIKDLNDIEKEILRREDTIKDNITYAINSYSSLIKQTYDLQLESIDFLVSIRAKQISSYMSIMKFLLSLDKKGNKEEVSESSIFESIEFI